MATNKKSARDLFNKQNTAAEVAEFEEVAATVNDFGPRIKLNEGMNILWPVPALGSMASFVAPKKIHYGPMHVCGRAGKYKHAISGKIVDDREFSKCYRCTQASDAWKADGQKGKGDRNSQDPQKAKFKEDMPNDGALIQAVDFTPFFMLKGRNPVFNEKLAEYVPDFVAALAGDLDALERLPNEDLKNAAEAGVCAVIVNHELSVSLIEEERTTRDTFELRAENGDETLAEYVEDGLSLHPEAFLVSIERGKDTARGFTGRDGKERYPATYTVKYLTSDNLVGKKDTSWSNVLPVEDLLLAAFENGQDLKEPRTALEEDGNAELNTLASNFVTLTHSEMKQYLEEVGHTFTAGSPESSGGVEIEEASGIDMSDPDDFDSEGAAEVMADAAAKDAIAKARALKKAEQEEDVA
jgi:hypothetical protein